MDPANLLIRIENRVFLLKRILLQSKLSLKRMNNMVALFSQSFPYLHSIYSERTEQKIIIPLGQLHFQHNKTEKQWSSGFTKQNKIMNFSNSYVRSIAIVLFVVEVAVAAVGDFVSFLIFHLNCYCCCSIKFPFIFKNLFVEWIQISVSKEALTEHRINE